MKNSINSRIDPDLIIDEELFSLGLVFVTKYLCEPLKEYMEKENRFLGIVKSYMSSIYNTYNKVTCEVVDENCDEYTLGGRILFLLKPILVREFNRLRSKKISEGDCIILMIRRILQMIIEIDQFSFSNEAKTLEKIIEKLYSNIKNKNKKDVMYNFSNQIRNLRTAGNIGKYSLDKIVFSLPKKEKTLIDSGGTTLINEGSGEIKEVDL